MNAVPTIFGTYVRAEIKKELLRTFPRLAKENYSGEIDDQVAKRLYDMKVPSLLWYLDQWHAAMGIGDAR